MPAADTTSCPLCKAPVGHTGTPHDRDLYRCPACDLLSIPPHHHLTPDAERQRYLHHQNSRDDPGYVATLQPVIHALQRHGLPTGRVLDYGCGPAPVLVTLLREAGYDATGYDPHFAPTLKPPTDPFDAVVATETVEHFRSPRADFAHMLDHLRPGGLLVVTTRLHPGPDALADWWYLRDKTHVAFYSRRTFEHLAATFGLDLLECTDDHLIVLRRNT